MRPREIEQRLGLTLKEEPSLEKLIKYDYQNTYALNGSGEVIGLNLCNNKLTDEQTAFLWTIPELQALNLSENELSSVSIPAGLSALRFLNLSENKSLSEMTFESGLPNLEIALFDECALEKIDFPDGFDSLQALYLQKNKLGRAAFAGNYPRLKLLDLSENKLQKFSLPFGFKQLEKLYLEDNQITELDVAASLPALDTLHLRGNQLPALSEEFLGPFKNLETLYLYGNPLPDAIRGFVENDSDKNCLQFIKRYFRELDKGKTIDNECKILLIGNGNVGKSCLARRLVKDEFEPEWTSTHGIILAPYQHREYVFNIWDFGGQDIYHATHRLFMQSNAIYLIVWDWKTENSDYTTVEEDGEKHNYKNHRLAYWLDYAIHLGKGSPVIVVQSKTGRDGVKELPNIRSAYEKRFPFFHIRQIESQEDDWDENGFHDLQTSIRLAVKRTKTLAEIPENWAKVRQVLRDKQQRGEKRMTISDYKTLAKELEDPIGVLENWLVKTGVVFYQRGLFYDEIILNQQWAIDAIYTIFNRHDFYYKALQNEKGEFSGKDLERIWSKTTENEAERELFVRFMLSCEMCFETTKRKKKEKHVYVPFKERTYIAPQLLEEERPKAVTYIWMRHSSLHLCYTYPFLHYGVIQSFIVRTQTLAEIGDIWKSGILLKEGDQLAMVEASEETRQIKVQLTENGKLLLDKIRNLLEDLQDHPGEESVSVDGLNFVSVSTLKTLPKENSKVQAQNGEWVKVEPLSIFLNKDDSLRFGEEGLQGKVLYPDQETMRGNVQLRPGDISARRAPAGSWSGFSKRATGIEPSAEYPAKILFLAANPTDESWLQTGREHRILKDALRAGKARDHYAFLPPQFAVTIGELIRAVNDKPFIVHFSGHGYDKGIVITNESNESQIMPIVALERLFKPLRNYTQIVILNSCYSASQAKVISEYGAYVVGNNLAIEDSAAISFSKGFYNGLGEGKDFAGAYNDGVIVLSSENPKARGVIEVWKDGAKLDL